MFDKLKGMLGFSKQSDESVIVEADEFEEDGSLFVGIVKLLLLGFTAYRSAHLLLSNLPPDALVIGFAGLGGLDLGLLAWSAAAQHAYGRRFALAMIGVILDMAGVAASVVADSSLVAGLNPGLVESVTVWVVAGVVVANICLAFAYDLSNPARRARHESRKRDARIAAQKRAAEDEIRAAELEVDLAERRAEAQAVKRQAAELRRTAVLRLDDTSSKSLSEMWPGLEDVVKAFTKSKDGKRDEPVTLNADGTDLPTNKRSKAAPK